MVIQGERFGPSFEEGCRADQAKCCATSSSARRGGQAVPACVKSDLPGRSDMKVTSHLLGRPVLPSSKEGQKRLLVVEPILDSSAFARRGSPVCHAYCRFSCCYSPPQAGKVII